MHIAVCKFSILIPQNRSLKGKRKVVTSLIDRIHHQFNVSIAEVSENDLWQIATLGFSCVSNSTKNLNQVINEVFSFIHDHARDYQLLDKKQNILTGF